MLIIHYSIKKISQFSKIDIISLAKKDQKDLVILKSLIEVSKVKPVMDRRYSLIAAAEALRYIREGHARGKAVIAADV